ncbi:MAG: metallophosphoesterase [Sedimenticola sp.]
MPYLKNRISRSSFIGIGSLLWAGFVVGRMYGHGNTGDFAIAAELLAMTWLGILLLTTVSLLAIEIITGFGLLMPHRVPMLRGLALLAGGALSALALIQGLRPPVIQDYEVHIPDLSPQMEGSTLAVLSDMHLGSLLDREWLEGRIEQTLALRPDMVLLLGDIFEGHGAPSRDLLPALRRLSAPLGVWAILGNHEFHGEPEITAGFMEEAGFRVLRNRWAEPRPGLVLAGVENPTFSRIEDKDGDSIPRALDGRPEGTVILISHAPRHYDAAAEAGVDLMLSGHTHGGQIWPFGYLVGQLFPLYEGGHEIDGMSLIVSRGTGTWGPRMRLWRPAEILHITLRRVDG